MTGIEPDPKKPRSSYAHMTDFLPFDTVVPLHSGTEYYEAALNAVANPSLIGAWPRGKSIRNISDAEFAAIARAGLAQTLDAARAQGSEQGDPRMDPSMDALIRAPQEEQERRISQMLVNRPLRDAAFRTSVVKAYDERCAVTRLRIVNGGGRAEVQAAHIWPVADGGPDIVQNGIALSATCHWLFDRHLISLTDDYVLLVSHNRVPSELRNLFEKQVDRNPPASRRAAMAATGVRHPASGPIRRPRTIVRAGYTGTRLQGVRRRQDGRVARANRDRQDCPPRR